MVSQRLFRPRQYEPDHRRHIAIFARVVILRQIGFTSLSARDPLMNQGKVVAYDAPRRERDRWPKIRKSTPNPPCGEPQPIPQRRPTIPERLPFHDRDRPKRCCPEKDEAVLHQRRNEQRHTK